MTKFVFQSMYGFGDFEPLLYGLWYWGSLCLGIVLIFDLTWSGRTALSCKYKLRTVHLAFRPTFILGQMTSVCRNNRGQRGREAEKIGKTTSHTIISKCWTLKNGVALTLPSSLVTNFWNSVRDSWGPHEQCTAIPALSEKLPKWHFLIRAWNLNFFWAKWLHLRCY